jgi:multisubunit Na+/H+ antiporter MnhB subunit
MTARGFFVGLVLAEQFALLLWAFSEAPPVTAPLSPVAQVYAERTAAEVGVTNVVAAINFDWRAYDTLGEATILLTSATGVKLLMRRYLLRRRETGTA